MIVKWRRVVNVIGSVAVLILGLGVALNAVPAGRSDVAAAAHFENYTLWLRAGAFDPLAGEPTMPAELRRVQSAGQPGLHLVQFPGPIQDEWLAALTQAGLEIVTYIPDDAYLVWGDGGAVHRLSAAAPLRWAGLYQPFYALHPALADPAKLPAEVDVTVQVYDYAGAGETVDQILKQAVAVLAAPHAVLVYRNLSVRVSAEQLPALAALPGVVNVEPRLQYHKLDEVQGQIMAGQLNAAGTQPAGPGYLAWLTSTAGFTTTASAYPIVDVTDDGIDNGTVTPLHPDFYTFGITTTVDRLVYNVNWTSDASADGRAGHGNLNASVVAGYNDRTGTLFEDTNGYNYGLGINPFGRVAGSKIFNNAGSWELPNDDYTALISRTYALGARISTNSWGANTAGAYTADDQAYDALVRDAQPGSGSYSGNQEITVLFSAGNAGSGSQTTGSPGNAKNVITVGAAENVRPTWTDGCGTTASGADSAQDIADFSSRGPTDDLRVKPDLVAPGTHIQGAASQATGYDGTGVCDRYHPAGQMLYAASSGTSHSAPAAAGAASLLYRYYQDHFGGAAPSPAMVKAYLINATRYLTGTDAGDTLPSNNQGYGELNLGLAFDGAARLVVDQSHVFSTTAQSYELRGQIADPTRPFRITLAWTDAPGPTTGNAYVNNLDLEVIVGGQTYRGNVFSGGLSTTGGNADPRNNVESVFLPAGTSGVFTVRVVATNIAGDGLPGNGDTTDQDFALMVYNGRQAEGTLVGWVYDGTAGSGLIGTAVQAAGPVTYRTTTNAAGTYSLTVVTGIYTATAWKYGYTAQTITGITVLTDAVVTRAFTLTRTGLYTLTGCVTDAATSAPLVATVTALGPLGDLITQTLTPQTTGCYAFTLYGGAYTVTAEARLHLAAVARVDLVADTVQSFALLATTTDGLLLGQVTAQAGGRPVPGATVQAIPGLTTTQTGSDGHYELQLPSGVAYTVTVTAPLYGPVIETGVILPRSNLLVRDYALPAARLVLSPIDGLSATLVPQSVLTTVLEVGDGGALGLTFNAVEIRDRDESAPDPFGYTYQDSQTSANVTYAWVDATDGVSLTLNDDGETNLTLPFAFKFYTATSSLLRVGNNGGLRFGMAAGDVSYVNEALASTAVNNLIVPLWDDLDDETGGVYYKVVGTTPNRRAIIEWYNRPHYKSSGGVGAVTFELILYEQTGNLKFQYQDVVFGDPANPAWDQGGSATVGIRQSGTWYQQYSYDQAVLTNSLAICFRYPGAPSCDSTDIPWFAATPLSGTVSAGTSQSVQAVFNSQEFSQTGVYQGWLRFTTNDPQVQPYFDYPVTMTVITELYATGLLPAYSRLFAAPGQTASHALTLTNSGTMADLITLTLTTGTWEATVTPPTVTLPAGGQAPLTVTVTVPATATAGLSDAATLQAAGRGAPTTAQLITAVPWPLFLPLVLRGGP